MTNDACQTRQVSLSRPEAAGEQGNRTDAASEHPNAEIGKVNKAPTLEEVARRMPSIELGPGDGLYAQKSTSWTKTTIDISDEDSALNTQGDAEGKNRLERPNYYDRARMVMVSVNLSRSSERVIHLHPPRSVDTVCKIEQRFISYGSIDHVIGYEAKNATTRIYLITFRDAESAEAVYMDVIDKGWGSKDLELKSRKFIPAAFGDWYARFCEDQAGLPYYAQFLACTNPHDRRAYFALRSRSYKARIIPIPPRSSTTSLIPNTDGYVHKTSQPSSKQISPLSATDKNISRTSIPLQTKWSQSQPPSPVFLAAPMRPATPLLTPHKASAKGSVPAIHVAKGAKAYRQQTLLPGLHHLVPQSASVTTLSPLRQSQHVASPQQQDLAARASAPPVLGSLKRARDEGTDLSENMNAKRPKA